MIVCVLRSGGTYGPEHVGRLMAQLEVFTVDRGFACLTDMDLGEHGARVDHIVPLRHGWPGWWSKIELFRYPGPLLYLDLSVTITGDLKPLVDACKRHEMIACADFWVPGQYHVISSSVMGWRGNRSAIYEAFIEAGPERIMAKYRTPKRWGDQALIRDACHVPIERWQQLLPGRVMSYKRDVLAGKPTDAARVIVYHGEPKPWDEGVRLPEMAA